MPASCSPSDMPGGSGRKVIAAQAGGAFRGALVAAGAESAVKANAKPIPIAILPFIAGFPRPKETLAIYPGDPPASRVNEGRALRSHRSHAIGVPDIRSACFCIAVFTAAFLKAAPGAGASLALVLAVDVS